MELHITGAWDAADASGIHNVFRYVFDISILASDTLGGTTTAYPLDPSGDTTIPKTAAPARFFRLRVTEQ